MDLVATVVPPRRGYAKKSEQLEATMSLADREDQEFGRKAAEDQERVDDLEKEGVSEEDLPEEPPRDEPRAGRKAEPDD